MKPHRHYYTKPTPAFAGFPGVRSERVYVTRLEQINGDTWCAVRFEGERSAKLMMHPSNLLEVRPS